MADWNRFGNRIALQEVDAQAAQLSAQILGFNPFGDRASTDHGSTSGDERTTTSEHARNQETGGTQETASRAQSHDGFSSQDDQEGDAPKQGDGAQPPTGDGGVAPATPNPALTVTVPTGDAPPPVGEPTPSSDGGSA